MKPRRGASRNFGFSRYLKIAAKFCSVRAMKLRNLLLLAACVAPRAFAADPTSIVIGSTLPLTGSESRTGGFYKEGYDLAFEEANAKGGLTVGGKKLKVELKLLDDTSTQATAASLADRLINSEKVSFLLGTYSSHLVE